jgi:hypothetical protein
MLILKFDSIYIGFYEFNYLNFINCINYGNKGPILSLPSSYSYSVPSGFSLENIFFGNCISYYIFEIGNCYLIYFSSIYLYNCYYYYYMVEYTYDSHPFGISIINYSSTFTINFQSQLICYIVLIPNASTYISTFSIPFTPPTTSNHSNVSHNTSAGFIVSMIFGGFISVSFIILSSCYLKKCYEIFKENNRYNRHQFPENGIPNTSLPLEKML